MRTVILIRGEGSGNDENSKGCTNDSCKADFINTCIITHVYVCIYIQYRMSLCLCCSHTFRCSRSVVTQRDSCVQGTL